ncbi:MAG: SpoIIE family protein phosphatase [Spirochaetes bacterium]|nr:SpoIIE family protein phosphatase [Spirochaetota bacterium]
MKNILPHLLAIMALFTALPLQAFQLDLEGEAIYARRGFDPSWTARVPAPGEEGWLVLPGTGKRGRSAVLKDLPFGNMPRRGFLSPKRIPPENFTFLISFDLAEGSPALERLMGAYFANIGENWAVYLNGRLIRSEVHLDAAGRIREYRHRREVLVPLDPRYMRKGKNILAARIIGDPTNIDSGFHRSVPFMIGDLGGLERTRSETAAISLIVLYFFIGLYHLFLFARMKEERHNLFYGAFSVLLFIYLFSRTHAVYAFVPDSTLLHRIEYCSLYALIPLFGFFADLLLAGRVSILTRLYAAFSALLALITAAPVSNSFAIDILRVWQVTAPLPLAYYAFVRIGGPVRRDFISALPERGGGRSPLAIIAAARRALGVSTAGKLMLGALVLAACTLFDILDSMFWAYDYVATRYGFFAFTMGIALILADRFITAHERLARSNELARNELDLAGKVQRSLLTETPLGLAGWEIAVIFEPMRGASGDLYDFYVSDNRLKGAFLFDVSGHGVSSALITMIVKPLVFRLFNRMRGRKLDEIITTVNRHLEEEFPRLATYLSCVLLRFAANGVEYVNAGHPDVLHRSGKTERAHLAGAGLDSFRGEPLGVNISRRPPGVIRFRVHKGDLLLLYTDGVIEGKNARKERFGETRLMSALEEAPDGTAREALEYIAGKVYEFIDPGEVRDDITLVLMKRTS